VRKHSLDVASADVGELELCARTELCRRKGLLAVTGIRSGVLREAPGQITTTASNRNAAC